MPNKKKILHLITGLEVGGAEMMLLKTLPRLREDFDHHVCCLRGRGPIGTELEKAGITVSYLDLGSIFDFGIIFRFREVIQQFRPDTLVTYLIHADLFGRILGRLFGIKTIICSVRVKLIQAKYLPLLLLDAFTSPFVSHYHFNSQTVADMYQRWFCLPKRKITVIPNGLEIEKYNIPVDIEAKKRALSIPAGIPLIGCVGRLEQQKGHRYLIEALALLKKNNQPIFLVIVGDGSEREVLERQARNLKVENALIFLGRRNDVPEILQLFDAFVLPSLYEGMSNALMEAMAVGLPIVATNIPENEELITAEKTGLLVPPKDSSALAAAVERILADTSMAASLKENAQKRASQQFDITSIVSQYREFYSR